MGFGIREGRRQARENLSGTEDGDCDEDVEGAKLGRMREGQNVDEAL